MSDQYIWHIEVAHEELMHIIKDDKNQKTPDFNFIKNEDSSSMITLVHEDDFTSKALDYIVSEAFREFKKSLLKRKDLMIRFSDLKADVYVMFHCSKPDCEHFQINIDISF